MLPCLIVLAEEMVKSIIKFNNVIVRCNKICASLLLSPYFKAVDDEIQASKISSVCHYNIVQPTFSSQTL